MVATSNRHTKMSTDRFNKRLPSFIALASLGNVNKNVAQGGNQPAPPLPRTTQVAVHKL